MMSKKLSVLLIISTLFVSMAAEAGRARSVNAREEVTAAPNYNRKAGESTPDFIYRIYTLSHDIKATMDIVCMPDKNVVPGDSNPEDTYPSVLKTIIEKEPDNAKTILKDAITAFPNSASDFLKIAFTAAPTPEARRALAAVASEAGISLTVINSALKTVTNKSGSYEVFSVKGDNTSKVQTITETTSTVNGNITTSTTSTQSASGGGGCNRQIASCT